MAGFQWKDDIGESSIASLEALVRSSGIGFSVSSAYRPNDPGYHGKMNAIDIVSSPQDMHDIAAYLNQYSAYLLELIHTNGSFFVKDGARGYRYSDAVVDAHRNHIHLATTLSALRAATVGTDVVPANAPGKKGCLAGAVSTVVIVSLPILIGGLEWIVR